jgi:hypothetical protein
MATYTYPSNDLEQRRNLIALLGSFWSSVYGGRDVVESHVFARGQQEIQNYLDLLETVAAVARTTVPVFHRENWHLLTLKESELNSSPARFGEGFQFGDAIKYGTAPSRPLFHFPVDSTFKEAPVIFNRITDPSLTLTENIEFELNTTNNEIVFNENPFDNPLVAIADIYTDGVVTDREAGLWVYQGGFDRDHIYTHFGFILNLKLVSSEDYRNIVNAVLDAFAQGTAALQVNLALSAMTGVPTVRNNQETVELIQLDHNNLVICTDLECYTFAAGDTANVAVGDNVSLGQFMTNAIRVDEINRGVVPSGLYALSTGPETLGPGMAGDLSWINELVDVTVQQNQQGRTKVSWPLGGFPTDFDYFWDEVHRRGVEDGTTLAQLIDIRRS